MKITIFLLTLIISISASASLKKLVNEFTKNNYNVMESKAQKDIAQLEHLLNDANKPWYLNYNMSKSDNSLSSMPGSTVLPPYETTTHILSLGKDFDWGGTLGFSNQILQYDGAIVTNGFTQGVTYSQQLGDNFLGRISRNNNKLATAKKEMADQSSEISLEQNILSFINSYRGCSANKLILKLQTENLDRAILRTKTVNRRVRDGLSLKVELIQTQMAENAARESVENTASKFSDCLKDLEALLHRNVTKDEVEEMKLVTLSSKISLEDVVENPSLIALRKKQIEIAQINKENAQFSILPKIELSIGYKTNAYADSLSASFSDGVLTGENIESTVGINLSWPIFSRPQKISLEIASINHMLALKKDEVSTLNFTSELNAYRSRLSRLEEILKSVKTRLNLAQDALKEYNNLYALGKTDIDMVLRAEESLIATQLGYAQSLIERDVLESTVAFKIGQFQTYLEKI